MVELLIGFALGGLAFTKQGHKIGNEAFDIAMKAMKKAAEEVKKNEGHPTNK